MDLSRERYAQLYGPTQGDRIRLADTDLLIEVEEDRCGGPGRAGEEAVFGGGKVIRESMGQGRATRAEGAPDLVITGALVLDHWGVIKADVGVRGGRIVALGKAGNPETSSRSTTPATGRCRSARTSTSPRRTAPCSSTGRPPGGTAWTSPPAPPSASSPASPAP